MQFEQVDHGRSEVELTGGRGQASAAEAAEPDTIFEVRVDRFDGGATTLIGLRGLNGP